MIGFAASGKSSVGKLLAEKLNVAFVDTDAEIQRHCGLSVQEIFDRFGEAYFRQKENELLASLAPRQNIVVACGGGSVLAENFRELADDSVVIWLTATAATVKSRLGNISRPLFDNLSERQLAEYIDCRAPFYRRYAQVTLPTDDFTVEELADRVIAVL